MNLEMIYRPSLFENGTVTESNNLKHINELLDYLKTYKCITACNYSYRDHDKKERYIIIIKTNNKELLMVSTIGDDYIAIKDKQGHYGHYEIINGKLDIGFLEKFFNSLGEKIPE